MIGLLSYDLKKDDLKSGQASVSYESGSRFEPALRLETRKEEKIGKKKQKQVYDYSDTCNNSDIECNDTIKYNHIKSI